MTSRVLATLAVFVATSVTPLIASADLNSQAQTMFRDLGVVGNVTHPQAVTGQQMNTYTGGSLFIRSPSRTYQLASVQLPYIRAGCGGIDLFAGSFSHISSAHMKNVLKNITSAIPGVIFQLLLKSVEPLLGSTVEYFQGLADMVNRQNISSCQMATMIVSNAAARMGSSATSSCTNISTEDNTSGDIESANERCQDSGNVASANSSARGDAARAQIPPFAGNLVWASLKRQNFLDNADRELIMSITGTTVYSEVSDSAPAPNEFAPTIKSMTDVLYGSSDVACAVGNTCVMVLRCDEYANCANPHEEAVAMSSLITRVNNLMASISTKIQDRTGNPAITVAETNFINSVSAPVYRLLAVSTALPTAVGIVDAKIAQYAEYVAVEFAYGLLSSIAHGGRRIAGNLQMTDDQAKMLEQHRGNADRMVASLQHELQTVQVKMQTFAGMVEDIERMQRTMRLNMAQQMTDLMSYSSITVR